MTDVNRIERDGADRGIWLKLISALVGAGLVAAIGIVLVPGAVVLELALTLVILGLFEGVCASLADRANRI